MMRTGIPRLRAVAALAGLLLASCEETRLAGTSSGVDNPQLTVGFRDETGDALQVTGELAVYARDQNPALDPRPLWIIPVRNATAATLTGGDFRKIREVSVQRSGHAFAKSGASSSASADTAVTAFNLLLRTQDRTGALLMELRHDPVAGSVSRAGGPAVSQVDAHPIPLVRYEARLARKYAAEPGRVYVPGTPFVATLVDSAFAIGELPPGVFPMRTLTADGYVYPIRDSLNTGAQGVLHQSLPVPVEVLDISGTAPIPGFAVSVSGAITTDMAERYFLDGKVSGIDAADPRVSLLWRRIAPTDSVRARAARILTPLGLRTEAAFDSEGLHVFVLSASVGLRTVADTIQVTAKRAVLATVPAVLSPRPGDTVRFEVQGKINWELGTGSDTVRVEMSTDAGATWNPLSYTAVTYGNTGVAYWTPSSALGVSDKCLVRVSSKKDPAVQATMKGFFSLRP